MHRKYFEIISLASLLFFSHFSFADIKINNFSGLYVGGSLGAVVDADSRIQDYYNGSQGNVAGTKTVYSSHDNPEGLKGSGFIGYNFVNNKNILLGVEASYNFYSGADDEVLEDNNGVVTQDYAIKTKIEQDVAIKGRIGYIFNNDKTLGYMTGGYTTGRVKLLTRDFSRSIDGADTKSQDGYIVGFGVEHFLNNKFTARVEYNYTKFNEESYRNNIYQTDMKMNLDFHSVQAGLAYHF
jgi:outer membrane immunogenic protein